LPTKLSLKSLLSFKRGAALTAVLLFSLNCHAQQLYEFTATKYLMGTKFDITAISNSIDSMKRAMYFSLKEVERIQGVMSSTIDTSEIYKINTHAGETPVKVSYETYSIIERSINYSQKYGGIFDITIGCITELWGFSSDNPVIKIPPQTAIDSLVKLVGYGKIILNPADTSVFLPEKGMKIDLGGIAKGYAIDRAADEMKKNGMSNFFVNGGGDIRVCGSKSETEKWSVGIEHPRKKNAIIASLEVKDLSVGTSGDYERFAIINGVRYHHIFNVKTGYPSMTSESATAIANTTEEAVVLSKILFIRGAEEYINDTQNVPGVIVDMDGNLKYDEKALKDFQFKVVK
jgi:thiamine biosynthesis lipoprotein